MSDDMWRRRERGERPVRRVRRPAVPGRATRRPAADRPDDTGERRLSFGPNDTGPLPHWTDPPTGEIPRLAPAASAGGGGDDDEDVDVWSSFTTESPGLARRRLPATRRDPSGGVDVDADRRGRAPTSSPSRPSRPRHRRAPADRRRPVASPAGSRSAPIRPACPGRPPVGTQSPAVRPPSSAPAARPDRPARRRVAASATRNMPAAIAAGVVLGRAVHRRHAVAAGRRAGAHRRRSSPSPRFEYFGKVTEKGYRPAVAPGSGGLRRRAAGRLLGRRRGAAARRGLRLHRRRRRVHRRHRRRVRPAAEHGGDDDGRRVDRPARLVRRADPALVERGRRPNNIGTDTLFLIVLGVVANDIGALFVGSAIGKTPLRGLDQPGQDRRGPDRRHVDDDPRAVRRRPRRVAATRGRHRRPADPRRRHRRRSRRSATSPRACSSATST